MLCHREFDVGLPDVTDFECADTGAIAFCHFARLSQVLGEIGRCYRSGQPTAEEETNQLLQSLQLWFNDRPQELHLFGLQSSRRPYSRVINELHIVAYVALILIYLLPGRHRQRRDFCAAATSAALCIDQLYGEVLHMSEVSRLIPIHSWFILFSVVPRYYCARTLALHGQAASFPDEQSLLAVEVLSEMAETYPSAQWVKERVNKIVYGTGTGLDPSGPGGRAAPGTPRASSIAVDVAESTSSPEGSEFEFGGLFDIPDDWCPGLAHLKHSFGPGASTQHLEAEQWGLGVDLDLNLLLPGVSFEDLDTLPDFSSCVNFYDL